VKKANGQIIAVNEVGRGRGGSGTHSRRFQFWLRGGGWVVQGVSGWEVGRARVLAPVRGRHH